MTLLHGRRRSLGWSTLIVTFALVATASAQAQPPSHTRHMNSKAKRHERAKLGRAVKRNPRVVLQRWFIRKAQLVHFNLPITFRLSPEVNGPPVAWGAPDDQIKFDLGTDPTNSPVGVLAGSPVSTVQGGFNGSLNFGADTTGYFLHPGVIELAFNDGFNLFATGIHLVEGDPACSDGNPLVRTDQISISRATSTPSEGFVDLFTHSFSFQLRTQFQFRSEARPNCGASLAPTNLMTGAGDPPVPLHIDGDFEISPGLTDDGYLRLGTLTATGTPGTPFAYVHTCTQPETTSTATCDGVAGDDLKIPARLSTIAFTGEMMIGSVPVEPAS